MAGCGRLAKAVSTHSRPKAAGLSRQRIGQLYHCFNTQPPEGGWQFKLSACLIPKCFNTQPPEGGWEKPPNITLNASGFNTQPPEGGWAYIGDDGEITIKFQHTAARRRLAIKLNINGTYLFVSTHSRPKAAGSGFYPCRTVNQVSTHSRPKAAGEAGGQG